MTSLARVQRLFLSGTVALLVGACAALPAGPAGPIATVSQVSGEAYVTHAGAGDTPAHVGDALFSKDGFHTQSGVMQISPARGGTVDAYQNTDPLIEESFCFAISFFNTGRIHVHGSGYCVNGVYQHSDVGYEMIGAGTMRVWVFEGQVTLLTPPFSAISAGSRADIQGGKIISRSSFSPAEFSRLFPPLATKEVPIIR